MGQAGDNALMNVRRIDLSDAAVATEVLAVQRAAYGIEAEMIGSRAIPPLQETLSELMRAPLEWLGVVVAGRVVAAIAYTRHGGVVDIDRLVVAPAAMRLGYASSLVDALGAGETITVSTATLNRPAHALYVKLGFEPTGESEPVPGLFVTRYVRKPDESRSLPGSSI